MNNLHRQQGIDLFKFGIITAEEHVVFDSFDLTETGNNKSVESRLSRVARACLIDLTLFNLSQS
jgi:hypothetical protein